MIINIWKWSVAVQMFWTNLSSAVERMLLSQLIVGENPLQSSFNLLD